MQTCKLFSAVSAAALLAAVVAPNTFAQDTDAQQKARDALRQKMSELDATKGGNSAPKAVTPPPVASPVQSAPVVTPPPPPPPPTPAPTAAPTVVTPPPPAAPVVAPVAAPTAAAPANDAESTEKARAALREKMDQLNAQPGSATAAPGTSTSSAKAAPAPTAPPSNKAVQAIPATPRALETPPPAVSASKEARLAELLRKYKSDAITPEEYHTQRAAIRAEP